MNERRSLWKLVPLCAAPLLSSCILRWDSSPEGDDRSAPARSGSDISPRGPRYLEPAPAHDEHAEEPTATSESEYPQPHEPSFPDAQYQQLIVIDPAIVSGPLASNEVTDAPFSFRSQMEWLAGSSAAALDFTRDWLRAWESTSVVGPELAPVTPRPRVRDVLVDAWVNASVGPSSTTRLAKAASPAGAALPSDTPSEADPGDYDPAGSPAPASDAEPEPSDDPASADDGDYSEDPVSGAPAPSDYDPAGSAAPPYAGSEDPESSGGQTSPSYVLPSWSHAPFRLIAVVNRVDLASEPCDLGGGEVRYVYAAVDPVTLKALDLTLILEVPYPTTRTAAEWASAWEDLAALPAGERFSAGLAELTRDIRAEGDPLRVRLRSNEVALSQPDAPVWEMREFHLQISDGALELAQAPLEFTPRSDADPAELSAYVLDHASEIERSGASLPEALQAGAASIEAPDFSWKVLGVSERLRRAFSLQTCNGCHGGDTASLPFRHIGPSASLGTPARLSRFLYDPSADTDELRRRADVVSELAQTSCEEPAADTSSYPRE
jgi:hypothetical protein